MNTDRILLQWAIPSIALGIGFYLGSAFRRLTRRESAA